MFQGGDIQETNICNGKVIYYFIGTAFSSAKYGVILVSTENCRVTSQRYCFSLKIIHNERKREIALELNTEFSWSYHYYCHTWSRNCPYIKRATCFKVSFVFAGKFMSGRGKHGNEWTVYYTQHINLRLIVKLWYNKDDNSRDTTKPNLAEEITIYLVSCDEDNKIVIFE